MCLFLWDYMINHNENEDEIKWKLNHTNMTQIDPNIVNIKTIAVWWCLYPLSNT